MKERMKKIIGELFLLVGGFITVYSVLNFSYGVGCTFGLGCDSPVAYYFYTDQARLLIGLGVALLIAGLLFIRAKKG